MNKYITNQEDAQMTENKQQQPGKPNETGGF